jgi:hypothetical protein
MDQAPLYTSKTVESTDNTQAIFYHGCFSLVCSVSYANLLWPMVTTTDYHCVSLHRVRGLAQTRYAFVVHRRTRQITDCQHITDHGLYSSGWSASEILVYFWDYVRMPYFLRSASKGSVGVLEEKFLKSKSFGRLRLINLVNSFRRFKIFYDFATLRRG